MKIEAKIKETQRLLQSYTKSALELGEIFKKMAEEKFKQKFEVWLGDYDAGVEYIRITMIPRKELTYRQRDKWIDKILSFEREIQKKFPTKGFTIMFGVDRRIK